METRGNKHEEVTDCAWTDIYVLAAYYVIQVDEHKAIERTTPGVESFSRISTPSVRVRGKISSLANKWDDAGPDKLGKVNERTSKRLFAS